MKKLMTRFKVWAKPYMKPSMFVSFGIAWLITNGWAYVFIAIGNSTLRTIGVSYVAFLWLPCTPEKLITIPMAVFIEKHILKYGHLKRKGVSVYREE